MRIVERSIFRTDKTTARVAGVLFIVATVADLLSIAFLGSLDGSDYLTKISQHEGMVSAGVLLLFIAAFACAGIAMSLYPVLKRYREGLAIGSVGFRIIEGMLYAVGAVTVLLLVTLSQEFVKAAAPDSSSFETLGTLLKAVRDWAGLAGILAFYTAALMYYSIFFGSRLIPRWLSVWGIAGVLLGIVAAVLILFHVVGSMSTVQIVLNVPIGVQEMVLAVWLIVKGFRQSPAATASAQLT
jgi:hypothetical protein